MFLSLTDTGLGGNNKLKQCFDWLGFEVLKKGSVIDNYEHNKPHDHMEYNFQEYSINPIIYSLLSNESLQSITTIDGEPGFSYFSDEYKDIDSFNNIHFTEVSLYTLDGELTELAFEGSVYNSWKPNSIDTKRMTTEFVNEIIEGRFTDFKIYRTQDCWSGYILGYFIAYFMFDSKKGEFWILSKDDFD